MLTSLIWIIVLAVMIGAALQRAATSDTLLHIILELAVVLLASLAIYSHCHRITTLATQELMDKELRIESTAAPRIDTTYVSSSGIYILDVTPTRIVPKQ